MTDYKGGKEDILLVNGKVGENGLRKSQVKEDQ